VSAFKPITIVGGGLAGLTLGIGLRRQDVPVTIWEAGAYPRHRVCGEFISGRGQEALERMGFADHFRNAGAVPARSAMFVLGSARTPVRQLTTPALCISRHKLDALLAAEFQKTGGELKTNSRWSSNRQNDEPRDGRKPKSFSSSSSSSSSLRFDDEDEDDDEVRGEGIVWAAGRRAHSPDKSARWFGLKGHVSGPHKVGLEADLEMHISPGGYVGMNRTSNEEVNVCGLFRVTETDRRPESKLDRLRGTKNSLLHERLNGAQFDPASFCSVAGLQLKPLRAASHDECCIGDRLTMTPPVTGNGMSMAFESAEIAVEPLVAYSRGRLDWTGARRQIAQRCDAAFQRRLAWARLLQWMMVSPVFQGPVGSGLLKSDWLWEFFFARTR
jgi:2-polyprenyl-6-methoxyphenol hydroxylase-like FAD-dependent oxidoreductase